jgi:SAM-dependent methyltransferase
MRAEWERNFWEYMHPHTPDSFRGKRVLDAGCGSGRHTYYAAQNNAEVWAIDICSAVEIAKYNTRLHNNVFVAQADIHHLPFAPESFDLIYSIGVLHHLPDPERAFRNLLRYLKPGGWIHIYLYWKPENQPFKRALLALVKAIRRITTHIPHRLVYGLSFPAAAIVFAGFVWPYQLLAAAGLHGIAERMPMKQYARYPFRVCVNDQFDRFSAPIEARFTREEVEGWMGRAGLEEIVISPNFGWCATGRKPVNGVKPAR